ncbi:hypothetical protein K438DRAFT_1765386 [Mycena galopus ATCC 62051]|nr:hypothetical protein K438DRAFT_1765386 [Mycena galopus ATCC 62051]
MYVLAAIPGSRSWELVFQTSNTTRVSGTTAEPQLRFIPYQPKVSQPQHPRHRKVPDTKRLPESPFLPDETSGSPQQPQDLDLHTVSAHTQCKKRMRHGEINTAAISAELRRHLPLWAENGVDMNILSLIAPFPSVVRQFLEAQNSGAVGLMEGEIEALETAVCSLYRPGTPGSEESGDNSLS